MASFCFGFSAHTLTCGKTRKSSRCLKIFGVLWGINRAWVRKLQQIKLASATQPPKIRQIQLTEESGINFSFRVNIDSTNGPDPEAVGPFILSMTRSAADILSFFCLHVMQVLVRKNYL